MVRSFAQRGLPKPFAILIAALLALYFVPLGALPASAAVPNFEIDGNQVSNGGEDWADLTPGTMPDSGTKTHRSLSTFVDNSNPTGADPTTFGSNNKEDSPPWVPTNGGQATGKSDYGRIASYSYVQPVNGVDHVFLVLGFDRGSNSQGSATDNYYFELNQAPAQAANDPNPTRTVGDIRINLNDDGSNHFTATVEKWDGSKWIAAPNAGDYVIKANDGTISSLASWWTSLNVNGGSISPEGFIETSLDLTSFGVVLGCPSTGFHTLNGRSTTGESAKNLVDYFSALPINIPSSCASLFIKKFKADGVTPLGGATFRIEPNPLPVGAPGRPNATFLTIFDDSTSNATVETGTNYDDPDSTPGVISISGVIPGQPYTITEVDAPTGWVKDGSSVTKTPVAFGTDADSSNTATFTNTLGKAQWEKRDATSGALICCATFRVQGTAGAAQTLGYDVTVKDDENNNTTLEGSTTADDVNDAAGVIRLNDLPTGTYTVTETAAPDGYDIGSPSVKTFVISSSTLNVDLTGSASNTGTAGAFQDPRLTPDVSAIKRDTTTNGPTLAGAQFQLFVDNGTKGVLDAADVSVTGHGTNPQTTGANGLATWTDLDWGDYLVVEQAAPTGYSLPNPKPVQAFSVTRANAGDNSRVFTFTDPRLPSTVVVTKKDAQGSTITTAPAQFGLYVDTNNDGAHQAGEPLVAGTTEANPQWTTTDGTQGASVDGTASWSNLAFGHYVVHELVAPQGYDLPANPDVEVDIDAANAGGTFQVSKNDPKLKTTLTVKKTDEQDNPLDGAVFELWQESNSVGGLQISGSADTLLGQCTTATDGTCTLPTASDSFEVTWPNTYYWREITPPTGFSLPAANQRVKTVVVTQANISDPFPPTVFTDPKPDIVTHATAADLPDGTITDYADLSGVPADATGTLSFKLYGPLGAGLTGTQCVDATKLVTSQNVSVSGAGRYPTGSGVVSATATQPGTYYWYVTFTSTDGKFGSAIEPCGSPNEVVTVNKGAPVLTTQATHNATYLDAQNGTIQDSVVVRPVTSNATGDLTVSVYGPFQSSTPNCSTSQAGTWTATAADNDGTLDALEYTVTQVSGKYQIDWTTPALAAPGAGYYFWKASYDGDGNNTGATHPCGEISETRYEVSHVDKAPVTVSTSAVPSSLITPAGTNPVNDEIFVKYDGVRPTGTVTVNLYGPLVGATPAQSCATTPPAHAPWVLNLADGDVVSDQTGMYVALSTPDFTPTLAGTYRWAASYSGDTNYLAKDATCPDPLEVTVVSKPELDKFSDPATVATVNDGTPTLVPRGSVITYSITVTNTGDAALTNKPLVDTLPDQVTYQDVTGTTPDPVTSTVNGHATLTWSVTLAPGASQTFTYTATVNADAPSGELLVNTARFLGLQDTTTHQVGVPAPTLEKTSPTAGQVVAPGDTIHYKVVVGNTGNFPITASPLVDTLPENVTFTTGTDTYATSGGGSISSSPVLGVDGSQQTMTWTVTLPAGATATVEFDAIVGDGVPQNVTLTNTAEFEHLVDTVDHHTGGQVPGIVKSSPTAGALVRIGDTIHYKVKVTNDGEYPITDSDVVDTLPDGVTYVGGSATKATAGGGSASGPVTGTDPDGHSTLTWTVTLPGGASATFEFDATVTSAVPADTTLTNTATFEHLVSTVDHHTGHPTPTLDKSSPTDGETVVVGHTIHYKVVVGNTGDYPLTSRPLVDTLPDGVTFVAGTATSGHTGGGSVDSGPVTGSSGGHNTLTWTVTLPPGATATVEFDALVTGAVPQDATLVNTAAFEQLTDHTTHYTGHPVPSLDKSSPTEGQLVHVGDTIHYAIAVGNSGPYPVTAQDVVDTLPDGVTFTAGTASSTPSGGATSSGPVTGTSSGHNTLTWTVTLPADSHLLLEFDALVTSDVAMNATLVNTATFLNLEDHTTHTTGHPTPTLDKSSPTDGGLVAPGDTIHYKVVVGNTGEYPLTSRPVVDTLPDGVTFVAGTATSGHTGGGSVDSGPVTGTSAGHNTLTWTVTLPPGATATVEFDALVTGSVPQDATLTNRADFEELVDFTHHHTGHITPTLDKFSDPVTDDSAPAVVQPGSRIDYSVKVGNTGTFPITDAPVVDTLPAHVTVVDGTISDGGVLSGDGTSISWTVSLAPGASKTLTYSVTVSQAVPAGELLVNEATFFDLEDHTTHTTGQPAPTLDKSSPTDGGLVAPGDTIHYKVVVGNTGDYPLTSRPLVDTLPDGVTFVAGTATSGHTGGGSVDSGPVTGTSAGHNTLTWTVTLPPGATATVEFDALVTGSVPQDATLTNRADFEELVDFTNHHTGHVTPTLDKFANPATSDSAPAVVQPGSRIDYSVKVGNTGTFPITGAPVVDTLPANVSVVNGTISDGGVLSADGKTITWTVTLAPGATKTLTYSVTVSQAAPQGALLVNEAKFMNLTDTTTHVVPTGALTLVKAVSPVAGNGVVVEFGDTLTYTLTVRVTGNLDQPNVVVTDFLPGRDPAHPASGDTHYVAGSATCVGVGACTVSGPDASGKLTWALGDMAAGSSRQVTFKVTIDDVAGSPGEVVAVDILNAGAVKSDRTPSTPSNLVRTPVSKVLPVKIPRELPHTGSTLPLGPTVGGAILLLGLGLLLVVAGRRRDVVVRRR